MNGQIKILLNNDGTVKIDARGMKGSVAEITKELESLAKEVGGELIVEKHEPGRHSHHGIGEHVHE
jgi:hypothetical protein